jgi:predicted metalloprotease with PDZ domain
MRTKQIVAFFMIALHMAAVAQQSVKVSLNLDNVTDYSIRVSQQFTAPGFQSAKFIFPGFVPGAFKEVPTGKLVSGFQAFDKNGILLAHTQVATNEFLISNARDMARVEYNIHDSWHSAEYRNAIMPQLGTSFDAGRHFLLNFGSVVGYVEGNEKQVYEIAIQKPQQLNAHTALNSKAISETNDVFTARTYLDLIDNPLMYSPDGELSFREGNTMFRIALNSYGSNINEQQLLKVLKPVCAGVAKFCNNLPVKEYWFLLNLVDSSLAGSHFGEEDFGAIQHSRSSVFFFPAFIDRYKLERDIQATASHELFHLFEPLNVKTDLTSKLNMRSKMQTSHLWLYEGVTEYFSLLMQLREDLITQTEFLTEIRNKMSLMQFYEPYSLTQQSEQSVLTGNENTYRNFYYKGTVAAMMLDLQLLNLSQGQLNLQELLLRFRKSMNENYVVKDEELMNELAKISSFKQIDTFFNDYVVGTKAFNYNEFLSLVGFIYEPQREDTARMYVNASYRYDKGSKNIYLTNINLDQIGFKEGDVLLKINRKSVFKDNIDELMDKITAIDYKKSVTFTVKRNGEEIKLSGVPVIINKSQKNVIKVERRPAPDKQFYRKVYKGGQLNSGRPYRLLN